MSKNTSKSPNMKKGKTLARRRLLDLAGSLSGPPSRSTCTSGSADLLSEVDPELSTAPNSSPSTSSADDSVADRHYNPDKDARVLDHDEEDDMDVDSDDPEEISPLVKAVKSHVRGCLREIPEPHHKDRKKNPVWNYFKKKITVDSTGQIKKQTGICQVMVGGAICGKVMAMPQASTTGPRNHLKNCHPKIWVELTAIAQAKTQVKRGATRALNSAMDLIEGEINFEKSIDTEINVKYFQLFNRIKLLKTIVSKF